MNMFKKYTPGEIESIKTLAANARQTKRDELSIQSNAVTVVPNIVVRDALADNGDGHVNLLPLDKLQEPLRLMIETAWESSPVPNRFDTLTVFVDGDERDPIFTRQIPSREVPNSFPLEFTADIERFQSSKAYRLNYKVVTGNDNNVDSDTTICTVDLMPPHAGQELNPLDLGGVFTVTEDFLNANGNAFPVTIPTYNDKRIGDIGIVYLSSQESLNGAEVATETVVVVTDPLRLQIPGAALRGFQDGTLYARYRLRDRVGNFNPNYSPVVAFDLSLSAQPLNPAAPRVDLAEPPEYLIDREDAFFPTTVEVDHYDEWLAGGDTIIIYWGTREIRTVTPILASEFPLSGLVTYGNLVEGGLGPKSVNAWYKIVRGRQNWDSDDFPVTVDMRVPGIPNPDPDPINPNLLIPVLQGRGIPASPANQLLAADKDLDADVSVTLWPAPGPSPVLDEYIQLIWDGVEVPLPAGRYVFDGTEAAGQKFDFVLDKDLIAAAGQRPDVPLQYRYGSPTIPNDNLSPIEQVLISTFSIGTLSPPSFPDAAGEYSDLIACAQAPWNGVRVRVDGDLDNFDANDLVEVLWDGWDYGADALIPGSEGSLAVTLTAAEAREGFTRTIPFAGSVQTIGTVPLGAGFLRARIKLTKVNPVSEKESSTTEVWIALMNAAGCFCTSATACRASFDEGNVVGGKTQRSV
ncbi:hypothetical protein [Pseudomonas abieticivorans]|uniref:hypothetical protein n=1 Tax=Pseudomonas abieticivorans TaxID=2931382 RepID=UPI0020BE3C02|nr:hypothetical protein [Pseudomonas sp. PIA16]